MSFTTWPLNSIAAAPFLYVNNIISSSSANAIFIAATRGAGTTTSVFNTPTNTDGTYVINDIISAQYLDGTPTNQGASFAQQSVLRLQNSDFVINALTSQGVSSFAPGLFDQFSMVSTIILSMIAYGNTDQLSTDGSDLITQWPHQIYSNMLTINDAMTYIIRQLGEAVNNVGNYANTSEWRWMYPQRSRCITPTTLNIVGIIAPTVNPANNIAYPSGAFRWDLLRYDFYNSNIYNTALERNTLLNTGLIIDNSVFTLIYDNVAAPGCVLLMMKISINYNDGTGSVNDAGLNTSRRILNVQYTNSTDNTYPTVFRVGFEWIFDFIDTMSLCTPVESPGNKALLYGGDLITS